jgi:hypothetical protein
MVPPKRVQIKIQGSSRNPEYNLASNAPHFSRAESGRRFAPRSQLNTHMGRELAKLVEARRSSYSEGFTLPLHTNKSRLRSTSFNKLVPEQQNGATENYSVSRASARTFGNYLCQSAAEASTPYIIGPGLSDRDLLPSQRSRSEISRLTDVARDTSRKGSTRDHLSIRSLELTLTCPECLQSDLGNLTRLSASLVCKTCRRFNPSTITTFEDKIGAYEPELAVPPVPPSKFPYSPKCRTCLLVRGDIYHDFIKFFPTCLLCGQLDDVTFRDLIKHEGEIKNLAGDYGNHILRAPKELQDWCVSVVSKNHSMIRLDSKGPFPDSISSKTSKGLQRSEAVKRMTTTNTSSRIEPIQAMSKSKTTNRFTRRFSFEFTQGAVDVMRGGQVIHELPSHESGLGSSGSLFSASDSDLSDIYGMYLHTLYSTYVPNLQVVDVAPEPRRVQLHDPGVLPQRSKVARPTEPKRTFTEILESAKIDHPAQFEPRRVVETTDSKCTY